MSEDRNNLVAAVTDDVDLVECCDQILSAVNILVLNLDFVAFFAERVDGDARAAVDDSRGCLDKITEIARAIQQVHERRSSPPTPAGASKT